MLRQYTMEGTATNTASSTLPLANLISTAAILPEVTEMTLGSSAVASNSAQYVIQRGTTIGGGWGSTMTGAPVGPWTVTGLVTGNQGGAATGPTLTANTLIYAISLNQQASYRFLANPGSGWFILQAAAADINLLCLVAATAYTVGFSFTYSE